MQCPQCSRDNPEGAKFCGRCGAKLARTCAQCGAELPADPEVRFCFECGAEIAVAAEAPVAAAEAISERLQRLVPKEYAERLLATRGQVPAERRLVTILFSDVKGSTAMAENLDPEEVMEIMDGAFDVLIEPIFNYEGTLARLMGDAVLAFFGAPIAHEDDPERAIRASLEITAEAAEYAEKLKKERGLEGFNVRVGINTGLVVVGEVGSDLRVEYTAMGDAINLAARLEQNAPPGGILITHDTYRHVRGVFDVLRQQPLTVKGKRQPVQTYLVQRAKPRAFRKGMRGVEGIETRMIGRQAELSRLQEAFYTAMEDRELQVATIVGEAGVGKSRLLHEFDIWSDLLPESFYFFKGRALHEMQGLPYSLIRDLFAFRFQIDDTDPLSAVREKWEQGVQAAMGEGEDRPMRAHLIAHLLGFELRPSPHLEGVGDDPKQLRELALTYMVDYFKALASEQPVLILMEDLHWADDSSLDLLNELALKLVDQPVMIVAAGRPALFERRPHWGEGQAFHRRLPLEPLTKRNTRRLLQEILQRVDQVPDTLSELVVTGAEGNPFFVEELVKMLVEDGVIVTGEEQWRVDPSRLTEVHVPPTLRGVLQARLDRLPLEERTVLQQAAVVGRLFWDRAVVSISESAAAGVEQAEVLNLLSALRGREMVFQRETTDIAGAREYIFKHAVLREVTYESVLKRLRRIYHGLVADWLMEQSGERVGEYAGLIADHLELAGRSAEAVEHLLEAGDRARGLYAHQEAINAYQRALAVLKDREELGQATRILMKLGLTYHTAFDFDRAREAYEEAFSLAQQADEGQAHTLRDAPHALGMALSAVRTIDPSLSNDSMSCLLIGQLFRGLVSVTSEHDIVPELAARWEVSEGGRRYVFHLREDMLWSDGVPVTAGDFEYAWKRVLDPATGSRSAGNLYDVRGARAYHQGQAPDPDEVRVRALDDFTLEVELEGPSGYFLHLLAHTTTYPVPRHVLAAHGFAWTDVENIVTNGPFTLRSWIRDQSAVLLRDPLYRGRSSGNVQQVDVTFLDTGEWRTELEMYEADRLDAFRMDHVPPKEWPRLRQIHAGERLLVPSDATFYLVFDVTRAPFDDCRVRQALAYALDRTQPAHALEDWLFPATGGFVPPGMPGHSSGIALPYDPDLAQRLLAEAGYPGGQRFPALQLFTWPRPEAQAKDLQAQWRENLGIEFTVATLEWAQYIDLVYNDPPQLFWMGWQPDYPDPDSFLRVAIRVHSAWRNETYDRLVEQARLLTDQAKRMRLYRQAERILAAEVPILPLSYERLPFLLKPWVRRFGRGAAWKDIIIEPH